MAVLVHGWAYYRSKKRVDLDGYNRLKQRIHAYSNHQLIGTYNTLEDKCTRKKLSSYEGLLLTLLENEMILRELLPKGIHEIHEIQE
jgi:hypothetical protein